MAHTHGPNSLNLGSKSPDVFSLLPTEVVIEIAATTKGTTEATRARKGREKASHMAKEAEKQLRKELKDNLRTQEKLVGAQNKDERNATVSDYDEDTEVCGYPGRAHHYRPQGTPTKAEKQRRRQGTDPTTRHRVDNDRERAHIWVDLAEGNNGDFRKGEPGYVTRGRNSKNGIACYNMVLTPPPHRIPTAPAT